MLRGPFRPIRAHDHFNLLFEREHSFLRRIVISEKYLAVLADDGVGGCIRGLVWGARGYRGVAQHGRRNRYDLLDPTKIPKIPPEQIPQ
jgi:hypothetical protein